MTNNTQKISNIYFELFDLLMTYNHKIWKSTSSPLPVNDCIVLHFLQNNGATTITKTAQYLSISKQQMSLIIDRLAKKELVMKQNLSKDRRYVQLSLSLKGEKILKEMREQTKNKFMERITDLSNEDTIIFDNSVKVIEKMLAKMFRSDT